MTADSSAPRASAVEQVFEPGELVTPLPFPITFVHLDAELWRDIAAADPPPLPGDIHHRFRTGEDAWVLITYLVLKHRGHDVRLSGSFVPGALCIAHYNHIRWRQFAYDSFVVAIRADRGPVHISEHRIVQSPGLADGRNDHFVPYWPQPGLLPRDAARADRVERIGFMGQTRNLAEELRSDGFRARLAELGMELVLRTQRPEWGDYRDIDVVLAVRGGKARWLLTKPPSKLVNAWLAGCPAVLGSEPAFEALRHSELDYLRADDASSVLAALQRLRDEEGLYRRMVANGLVRAREYGIAEVARAWEAVLGGAIGSHYADWSSRPLRLRRTRLLLRYLPRAAKQRILPNRYMR